MNKRSLGSCYETIAAAYLTKKGYVILEKNFRSRAGEIDLIARHTSYLVFIEVKYRKNDGMGHPGEAVDIRKQQRIRAAARYYLHLHHIPQDQDCRFDVVCILGQEITLFEHAF